MATLLSLGISRPARIVPPLADRGQYIASESTFYRVLKAESQLQHRGAERPKQQRSKPRALCATAPNQLFSWDITYLPTRVIGIYFYLYLFLDIYRPIWATARFHLKISKKL